MNGKPKPGSSEEMRGWIDLVRKADKDGEIRTQLEFPRGIRGTVALIVSILTLLAVMAQGIEAGRSFLCNMHWISTSCSTNPK
jgi:hypothetical protein